jgi:hypothetical protein
MAVPVLSISCCVLNHHNLFYQIHNALAFNRDTCCHLALCLRLLPFHSFVIFLSPRTGTRTLDFLGCSSLSYLDTTKSFVRLGVEFTTLISYFQLKDGPDKLKCHITLGWKGLQDTKYKLSRPFRKLRRKWIVVNTTSWSIFTTLYFLRNFTMDPIS